MKAVIAIDSFKGSLSSIDAGNAAAEGIRHVFPDADIIVRPVADGGEGTVDALVSGLKGEYREAVVTDPLGRKIKAVYGILPNRTAVIEMAAASGLPLLSAAERDPLKATTYGTGELIRHAIKNGCRRFIIGIGGSATNDGGAGCLQALGFDLLDSGGRQIGGGAAGLSQLAEIRRENVIPELGQCEFHIACDVTNPLCGDRGCSKIFAPQKGADSSQIEAMDGWLRSYAELTKACISPNADPDTAGAGAAGGMGFALMYYLDGTLEKGSPMILRELALEADIADADIVITGEGCIDGQTAMGKTPAGVAELAKGYGKPVIAFCGCVGSGAENCRGKGIDAWFPIVRGAVSLEAAMDPHNARKNLADTAEQVFRVIALNTR